MKRLAILGSTGSIGRQTLDIVRAFPEEFSVVGLSAGHNLDLLAEQAREFQPEAVSCEEPPESLASSLPPACLVVSHEEVASHPDADTVMAASVGKAGLAPILAAIRAQKTVALANKEPVVMAGHIVMGEARRLGVDILPVDSEPSAIWQCLRGEQKDLSRVVITASGGAFRNRRRDELAGVTPEEALQHPNLEHGQEDNHRLRHTDEQGLRGD